MDKKHIVFLFCCVLLGFGLRFYKLTESPGGLYIDEASIGYNAWSIVTTGKDEHGVSWPLFFEAFGEWKLPVYIYSVAFLQLFLGPTDVSVRLPAVLFGTMTIPALYLFVRELIKNNSPELRSSPLHLRGESTVALFASFLMAVSPWHFQFTHAGFEASAAIFFLVLGLSTFFKAKNTLSVMWLFFSLTSFVLSLYSYNSARLVVPAALVFLCLLFRKSFPGNMWFGVGVWAVFLSIPFILFALSPAGLVRVQQIAIWVQVPQKEWLITFLSNYWKNVSPRTLFVTGDPTIASLTPHRMSLLYLFELPFFIWGMISILKSRRSELYFILGMFFVGLVSPALTTLNPHALRGSLAIPFAVCISSVGLSLFVLFWKKQWRAVVLVVMLFLFGWSTVRFLTMYHTEYTKDAGWDWHVDIKKASLFIKERETDYEHIFIDNRDWGATQIVYLWHMKYPPQAYQQAVHKNRLGRYLFGINPLPQEKALIVSRTMGVGNLVEKVLLPNGNPGLYIYESIGSQIPSI